MPENANVGQLSRSLDCVCHEDLVDSVKPGIEKKYMEFIKCCVDYHMRYHLSLKQL